MLREHPSVAECAVVGVMDEEWGERVCAAVVLHAQCMMSLEDLRAWAKPRLAAYKLPTRMLVLESLPRNVMGKVEKRELAKLF